MLRFCKCFDMVRGLIFLCRRLNANASYVSDVPDSTLNRNNVPRDRIQHLSVLKHAQTEKTWEELEDHKAPSPLAGHPSVDRMESD